MAAYYAGLITFRGECGSEADESQAVELIRIAAEAGYAAAQRDMGKAHEYGWSTDIDLDIALDWYEQGASNGDPPSLWRVGIAYVDGKVRQPDSTRAVEYFRAAADAGFLDGMVSLGVMYATGDGVEQDFSAARQLYEQAAESGSAAALKNLGVMYMNGEGVGTDPVKAMLHFEQAVALGSAEAVVARDQLRPALSDEDLLAVEDLFRIWLDETAAE
jgi:hypothetical protein